MEDFYLYGGGINALAVCDFFQKSNIKAIIDRDSALWGQKIRGIPIISLDDYKKSEQGEKILIAAYDAQESIIKDFENKGVRNYYRSPWMQSEFYRNREDVIEYHKLDSFEEVLFYQEDPVSVFIAEDLDKKGTRIGYVSRGDTSLHGPIVVSTNEEENELKQLEGKYPGNSIIRLNKTKRKDSYDYAVLKKFKDIHKGKRCFLVGNGPSVTYEDLDILYRNKEICFGVNSIYRAFDNTLWRPNYYVTVDQYFIEENIEKINDIECTKFFRHLEYVKLDKSGETYDIHFKPAEVHEHKFSMDIEDGVYTGDTVLYDALQIAVYMGFSDIYLIGADMSMGLVANSKEIYFYEPEKMQYKIGRWDPTPCIESFGSAQIKLKKKGISLKNATRNAWWDNVPRVNFDELF